MPVIKLPKAASPLPTKIRPNIKCQPPNHQGILKSAKKGKPAMDWSQAAISYRPYYAIKLRHFLAYLVQDAIPRKFNRNVTKVSTLKCLIAEHAHLIIFHIFSILLTLIRYCSLNCFEHFFHPVCLLSSGKKEPPCSPITSCSLNFFGIRFWPARLLHLLGN